MSEFVNARAGVKKIFSASILEIIAVVCSFLGTLFLTLALIDENGILSLVSVLLIAASFVLLLIAFIFNLIGLKKAGKDESNIEGAFWLAIAGIVVSVLGAILPVVISSQSTRISNIASVLSGLFEILIVIFVCTGVSNLAAQIGQEALAAKGKRTALTYAIVYALGKSASIIVSWFTESGAQLVVSIIILVVSIVLEILAYIWYITFLGKARKVL